ncbi:tRNA lysidine(34) synthetase TilS [Pseudomonas syringae]|uniref:tRNA(Ile)-lysidine synthase n=1 Tax=Pseudomonas syringae pv. papulans TaxID=83963 RepID=A0A0N8SKG5_PSESX|nr:tRNA lysidine(34) synthetase TilS [Pseudomonas syringae]KPY35128.1 tRNA-lysidine synthase [Pseudomonas syringae pv. papulans]KWS38951.1 tRNA(Ile)-lysidine synthase [Pseudomonas syringae pv. papulans]MDH4603208.1 tRNA lysidine(34) synthetase TilS [Pseudomonas syringae pv. papulans]MDH4624263.1 tRNA lysidine(34) synthetase TilS [Pseudomonas syringae pv. papulans]RMN41956.1 tRNA-lysidine synthase [Pseudomonas syringae pv. papulans]
MTTPSRAGHDLSVRLLQVLAPWRNAPVWHVGFSGGLDSTVLLHLLAELADRETLPALNAIHVHHGLQTAADAWPEHCQQVCKALGVAFESVRVQVEPAASLEQAARQARYSAFTERLGEGEVLLTGQHRDDQAETLLFRLLRGAGVRGLAAMPDQRVLGRGHLLRPLLDVSRMQLEDYARRHGLNWIEDPSNDDQQFSRNFLRNQVLPLLTSRWPQAAASLARTAHHLGEAQQLLDELALQDIANAQAATSFGWVGLPVLSLGPIAALSAARQRNAVRHWLAPLARLPDTDHWAGWEALRDAAQDAGPLWRLADGTLHRAQGCIWWVPAAWERLCHQAMDWTDPGVALDLPGNGRVVLEGEAPSGCLQVRYRQGGEVLRLDGRGSRDLKRLLNEQSVPAFLRGRLPLLYLDNVLLAVANLPGLDGSPNENWRLRWVAPTGDQSLS